MIDSGFLGKLKCISIYVSKVIHLIGFLKAGKIFVQVLQSILVCPKMLKKMLDFMVVLVKEFTNFTSN